MNELVIFLKDKIKNGEDEHIEFKKATNNFPNDALETISAFSNTDGGYLILGISEDKTNDLKPKYYISGVDNPTKVIDDMFNTLNNPQKISRNVVNNNDIQTVEVEDSNGVNKKVIIIQIHKEHYKNKPVFLKNNPKLTYLRYGTNDVQANDEITQLMIRDALNESSDSLKLTKFSIDDFDFNTIKKYRGQFVKAHEIHPFNNLNDESFLQRINALALDRDNTNKLVPTLAGLLVFGKHYAIKEVLPHYNVEYINKSKSNKNSSYIDRVIYDGSWGDDNLYNFFHEVIDKLYITINETSLISNDSITRLSSSKLKIAIREALINSIIHCDYKVANEGIYIIRYADRFIFRNGGTLRISTDEFFVGGKSDPRNYYIQEIFRIINLCEKAGTGIPKIMDAVKTYNYKMPEIAVDFDSFEISIWDTSIIESFGIINEIEKDILKLIISNKFATVEQVAKSLDIHRNTASKYLSSLNKRKILDKKKSGRYNVYIISQTEGFEQYDLINSMYTMLEEIKRNSK